MSSDISVTLATWLQGVIPNNQNQHINLQGLSGDAGARQYFTIDNAPEYLAVFAPKESENSALFIEFSDYLRDQGIRAPKVLSADLDKGFLLIENLGDKLYLGELNENTVEVLYGEAILALLCMQQAPRSLSSIEDYSASKLLQEVDLFPKWFVTDLLGYQLNTSEQIMIKDMFDVLVESANEQPQCFVHRDFHSRNLIACDIGPPGVIDFQDGVWGPFTYDLVSLLRDCYVRWPEERVRHWLFTYANMAAEVGIMPKVSGEQLIKWFDLMGLQRHIKVLGIFARLYLRDNKASYLQDLPLVIRYTLEVAHKYPECKKFAHWFEKKLVPLAQQQSWYCDYQSAGFCPVE
ncbi:MAG: aminoglycoside phosphotransferase family protein [Cellvibrionaceae bacterium]